MRDHCFFFAITAFLGPGEFTSDEVRDLKCFVSQSTIRRQVVHDVSASISELRREVSDETQSSHVYSLPTSTFDSITSCLSSLVNLLHWLAPFFRVMDQAASFISKAHAFWWVIKAMAGLYCTLAMLCVMPRERVRRLYRRRWRRAHKQVRNTSVAGLTPARTVRSTQMWRG